MEYDANSIPIAPSTEGCGREAGGGSQPVPFSREGQTPQTREAQRLEEVDEEEN